MRISDWSSDVCSSDLACEAAGRQDLPVHREEQDQQQGKPEVRDCDAELGEAHDTDVGRPVAARCRQHAERYRQDGRQADGDDCKRQRETDRSEEHTSELQSLMRISYAVFCLKKKTHKKTQDKCHHSMNTNYVLTEHNTRRQWIEEI